MLSNTTTLLLSRRSALLGVFAVVGCGLTPVYGTNGSATALRGAIAFDAPETVAGYRLRTRLIAKLGATQTERFRLVVQLAQTRSPATITTVGDTTRFNLSGSAQWALRDTSDALLTDGTVETFTSYSATGSTVATKAAETDAQARLAVALADLIVAKVVIAASGSTR